MSEVLICPSCNNIYEKDKIVKNEHGIYICPNKKDIYDDSLLIPVDENLADTVLKFINLGIMTTHCCEGHPHSGSDPYIVFAEELDNPSSSLSLQELYDLCIEINKELDNFWDISKINEGKKIIPFRFYKTKCSYFVLRTITPHKEFIYLNVVERLELKLKFIKSLELLIERIGKKLK